MKTRTFLKLVASLGLMLVVALPAMVQGQAPNRVDVLIGFVSPPRPVDVALVQAAGGQVRFVYSIVPAVAATVPEPALRGLARDHRVRYIEADAPVYATSQMVPWGVHRVFDDSEDNRLGAWGANQPPTGQTIRVAVLDTGVHLDHRDLAVAGGWNYWGGQPHDGHGHGTHVAGTIAALNNSIDVVGVAPGVSLYAVKVLYDNGAGSVSTVVAGMDWAVANGMDIVNLSLGSPTSSITMQAAMDNAYAGGLGILLIASAGNEGNSQGTGDSVGYPAAYTSVIAVAASDVNDQRASFSSTGPAVEITAPGVDILSTYPPYTDAFGPPNRRQTHYTRTLSGTSMASPHVAGVAALIMAANPGLSAGEVRDILEDTAFPLGESTWYGHGLVDATKALLQADGSAQKPPSAPTGLVAKPGDGQVQLTWNESRGATSYRVYGPNGESRALIAGELTQTSYVDSGLENEIPHSYVVCAVNETGESAESDEVTATPRKNSPSAIYVGADTATQGTWIGSYGSAGHHIYRQPVYDEPATGEIYAWGLGGQVTLQEALPAIWQDPSTSLRALQAPDGQDRFAACYFNHEAFFVEINLLKKSLVSFYFLDWEGTSRRQNIIITDAYEPFAFLDSRALSSSFNGGIYLTWELEGHVRIEIAHTGGANAVLSGIFFDPVAGEPPPPLANQPPVAGFSYSVSALTVDFTDTSTDLDGSVDAWSWNFGDGKTSIDQDPTYTYAADGTYTVSLTVTDNAGATGSTTQTVEVAGAAEPEPTLTMDSVLKGSSVRVNRNFWAGTVTVAVRSDSQAVSGATVQGTWSGGISGTVSGQTDATGVVLFSTDNLRNQVTDVTFTLTGVTKDGYEWSGTGSDSVIIEQP